MNLELIFVYKDAKKEASQYPTILSSCFVGNPYMINVFTCSKLFYTEQTLEEEKGDLYNQLRKSEDKGKVNIGLQNETNTRKRKLLYSSLFIALQKMPDTNYTIMLLNNPNKEIKLC